MKIYLDSVGCRLNQSEIENYAIQFRSAGHTLVSNLQEAQMLVLNTCAVTAAASADSRQKIRQASRAGVTQIVVTGCMSTLEPQTSASLPGVIKVVPNENKDSLVSDLLQIDMDTFDLEPIAREPIPGARMRTRAFIKVQDGCDNKCTFCVTTLARGESRSRKISEILADIRAALLGGAQEIVLTGVHMGSWGYDFDKPHHLRDLVSEILSLSELPRLRLSSLEPWDLDESFFDLWEDPRLCRHLHLPLQSGSGATLRRMARKTTPTAFSALLAAARERIPGLAITTDVIVGFPGESQAEFEESLAFVKAMRFSGAHVFTYSAREGTAAAKMPAQVHNFTRKERSSLMRDAVSESSRDFQENHIGKEVEVLWESVHPHEDGLWCLSGLTDNNLRITAYSEQPVWNQITLAEIKVLNDNGLNAEIIELPDRIILES